MSVTESYSPLAAAFDAGGALDERLPNYRPRAAQQRMAAAVAQAIGESGRLVVEAGTGTGKTFAYLVPALLSGCRIIISTGTKNLQEQLFYKDVPLVQEALKVPVQITLLKGRANYLCKERLGRTESAGRIRDPQLLRQLRSVREWSTRTQSGDTAEVTDVREDAAIWPRVTSTAENCLGSECEHYADCFVVKARRAAQEADVVVVNHHLLLADMALREEGFGEILPGADAVILDEAHQLPQVANQFFGASVTSRQMLELLRDAREENTLFSGETPELEAHFAEVEDAVRAVDSELAPVTSRAAWQDACGEAGAASALDALVNAQEALTEALQQVAERSRGLDQCHKRSHAILDRLRLLCQTDQPTAAGEEAHDTENDTVPAFVRWVEKPHRGFLLHATPLEIADTFRRMIEAHRTAWVFTSATLSVDGSFAHFTDAMGIPDADTLALESPFDYRRNALLYLPNYMPDPTDSGYTRAVVDVALPLLKAGRGGVFLLFTSHRALREAAAYLRGLTRRPLFVQSERGRGELLSAFRDAGDGVLLGTSSFWEGVDVRGEALETVVIDRLPFASPADPVLKARLDALRARGANPFNSYQLPQAVISLKQGVGRLIRDDSDRGVIVLCDPRIQSRRYGRVFLNSLPDLPVERSSENVCDFLAKIAFAS